MIFVFEQDLSVGPVVLLVCCQKWKESQRRGAGSNLALLAAPAVLQLLPNKDCLLILVRVVGSSTRSDLIVSPS